MDQSQELKYVFVIFIALFPLTRSYSEPLSRSGSFVTGTEEEAVQLEFPYPCDSNKVTIQSANRAPFYNSEEPEYLSLPVYQLHRFSVTNENCSVQVEINPVNKNDEATYICQAYRDGATQSELTRIRLNVNYPPGDVSCTFSINGGAVGDWFPLQCMAPVGSMAGGIYCYQDSKRLPPQSGSVENGETLKQTIWARKEYPVFCCSAILDRPKDRCDCAGFVWNPMESISHTKNVLDPCPATTPGPVVTLSQYPEREVEEISQLPQLIESLNLTDTNKDKSTANNITILWGCVTAILVMIMVIILIRLYMVEKTNKQLIKCHSANINQHMKNMEENESSDLPEKKRFLHRQSEKTSKYYYY
ncbi:uncharacterized protein LOC115919213 [Strongylocentrotus purpuratus]|uniref:Ig-like domain-containing protein n=1 Tax=Strongylocentrotus purpuratus TaxID=7668 RepID=A0A7M7SSP2_STRPU|nr:uncharacterized protein LOC115919213 [Strongylocentrotus purpuratus]